MTVSLLIPPQRRVPVHAGVLALASDLLPVVAWGGLVLCSDLYTVLEQATGRLGVGGDRAGRLVVASQAFDRFVEYLIATGRANQQTSVKQTLRAWLVTVARHDPQVVAGALAAAADHWRTTPSPSTPTALKETGRHAVG